MRALIVDEGGTVAPRLYPALQEEGYRAEAASTCGEARWLAGESEPDVVIVCSARPGVHDVPTVSALRADGEAAPILVLARRSDSTQNAAALEAGADDVVVSPVAFTEIAARLRALLRRGRHLAPRLLTIGTLRLDPGRRVVVRYDGTREVPIHLTPREFLVLETLMRNAGQVVSRTRLEEHVWGVEPDVSSNIVDQVVSRLRAKLEHPFGTHDLTTVRGVGYRLERADGLGAG